MKKLKLIITFFCLILFTNVHIFAQNKTPEPQRTKIVKPFIATNAAKGSDKDFIEINVTEPGKLAELMGERANDIDSLVVTGTINATDFKAMWSASFNGRLSALNLEKAKVVDGIVPDYAFFNSNEQTDFSNGVIHVIALRNIMLGEGITEIGKGAFMYATNLCEINLPSTLKKLGEISFSDCKNLRTSPLVLPEGLTEIPRRCFMNCRSLSEVTLPSTIRSIGEATFFGSYITKINFPEGLEKIGDSAFYGSHLEEAVLPSSCLTLDGTAHFALNRNLRTLSLPDGLTSIPDDFAEEGLSLIDVNMPSSLKTIGNMAFSLCPLGGSLKLPEGLTEIGDRAFYGATGIREVTFPSTLLSLGMLSCDNWSGLKSIRCIGAVPPVCEIATNGLGPFGTPNYNVNDGVINSIPVYVPKGSLELYRNSPGWDIFFNFIETEYSPAGIDEVYDKDSVTVSVEGSEIVISGKEGRFTIYSLDGTTIATGSIGNEVIRISVSSGYYIVNACDKVKKIRI